MKIKNVSSRLKNKAKNAACFGFGSAELMHAAGMLLLLLTLCGCLAGLGNAIDNTSPDALDSGVVSVSDNSANPGNDIDNTSPNAFDSDAVSTDNPDQDSSAANVSVQHQTAQPSCLKTRH